jgi:hypothetical protein
MPQQGYLQEVSDIYVLRHSALWSSRPELLQLLSDCTHEVITKLNEDESKQLIADQVRYYAAMSNCVELQRYCNLTREDFTDHILRLPDNLEPIDAQLADARIFAGGVRFPELDSFLEDQQVNILAQSQNPHQGAKLRGLKSDDYDNVNLHRPLL